VQIGEWLYEFHSIPAATNAKKNYCESFGFFAAGAEPSAGLTAAFCLAGAGGCVKAVFTCDFAEGEPSAGSSGGFETACAGGLAAPPVESSGAAGTARLGAFPTALGEPGDESGLGCAITDFTLPFSLAADTCGANADRMRGPVGAAAAALCAAGLATGGAGGLNAGGGGAGAAGELVEKFGLGCLACAPFAGRVTGGLIEACSAPGAAVPGLAVTGLAVPGAAGIGVATPGLTSGGGAVGGGGTKVFIKV
jgi:hypothetical protein